jgi:dihydroorotase-like cyclic amidohydrolase
MTADSFDLILRGAWVANADGVLTGSVGVRDGRVAAVWPDEAGDPGPADQVLDCTGKWVLPGGVDPHVHVGITFGAVATDETYE